MLSRIASFVLFTCLLSGSCYDTSKAAETNPQTIHIVYSTRAEWITYRAAEHLPRDLVRNISVITTRPTKLSSARDGFRKVIHIIDCSDLTPLFLDPIRHLNTENTKKQ